MTYGEEAAPSLHLSACRITGQSLTSWLMSTIQDTFPLQRWGVSWSAPQQGNDSINLWMSEILNRIKARRKVKVNLIAYYSHDRHCLRVFGDKDLQSHLLYITDNKDVHTRHVLWSSGREHWCYISCSMSHTVMFMCSWTDSLYTSQWST